MGHFSLTSMGVGFVGAGFGFATGDFVGLRVVDCDVGVDTGGAVQQSRVDECNTSTAHHQSVSESKHEKERNEEQEIRDHNVVM